MWTRSPRLTLCAALSAECSRRWIRTATSSRTTMRAAWMPGDPDTWPRPASSWTRPTTQSWCSASTRAAPRHGPLLDLRETPGGAVEAAVDVASLFLRRDQIVFRTTGRHRDVAHEYRTSRDGDFKDVDMVVLIDEATASAAEALAASLQDHDR